MTALSFDLVSHGPLSRMSAAFAPGTHVVLGSEHDGTGALIELAAGSTRPRTGHVMLDGQEPYSNANLRRGIAALFAAERLPPGRAVTGALGLALRARGDTRSVVSVLDAAGLAHWAGRRSAELAAREVRALTLAIVLSHPAPVLVALFEPLASCDLVSEAFVLEALTRLAGTGALVLTTASRFEDAARLGGATSALERGVWLASAALGRPRAPVTLRVHTPEPRRLAARLAEAPDVSAVEWAGGRELLVRGTDLEQLAAHVVKSARSEAIRIDALHCDPPGAPR